MVCIHLLHTFGPKNDDVDEVIKHNEACSGLVIVVVVIRENNLPKRASFISLEYCRRRRFTYFCSLDLQRAVLEVARLLFAACCSLRRSIELQTVRFVRFTFAAPANIISRIKLPRDRAA